MDAASAATAAACAAGAAAAIALLANSVAKKRQSQSLSIPSVGHYPIVGSHFHLREPWYLDLYERFSHHPITCVHYGICPVMIFNDWDLFKEAMVDNAELLAGRGLQRILESTYGDRGGIAQTDGELWRQYRRFTLKVLRDFGFGRKASEELISVEADHMCRFIDGAEGAGIVPNEIMSVFVSNIICQLVFGSRLASEDPNFHQLLEIFGGITQSQGANVTNSFVLSFETILNYFPQVSYVIAKLPKGKIMENFRQLVNYCIQQKEKKQAEMHDMHTATNYIEAHILHQKENPTVFNDIRMSLAVTELFIAGTDTTSNTLCWAILYMIRYPNISDKVHSEITNCIGHDRLPMMKDKTQLHYTQAVMEEVLRCSSLVTLGVAHRLTGDVRVGPYQLRKNDLCMFNVYAMHHDSKFFPNPKEFNPERHMQNGRFVPSEQISAFGLGKRACLGESLARMELFIFFATLMQRYRFALDPDEVTTVCQLTEDPNFITHGLLRTPLPHKVVFSARR